MPVVVVSDITDNMSAVTNTPKAMPAAVASRRLSSKTSAPADNAAMGADVARACKSSSLANAASGQAAPAVKLMSANKHPMMPGGAVGPLLKRPKTAAHPTAADPMSQLLQMGIPDAAASWIMNNINIMPASKAEIKVEAPTTASSSRGLAAAVEPALLYPDSQLQEPQSSLSLHVRACCCSSLHQAVCHLVRLRFGELFGDEWTNEASDADAAHSSIKGRIDGMSLDDLDALEIEEALLGGTSTSVVSDSILPASDAGDKEESEEEDDDMMDGDTDIDGDEVDEDGDNESDAHPMPDDDDEMLVSRQPPSVQAKPTPTFLARPSAAAPAAASTAAPCPVAPQLPARQLPTSAPMQSHPSTSGNSNAVLPRAATALLPANSPLFNQDIDNKVAVDQHMTDAFAAFLVTWNQTRAPPTPHCSTPSPRALRSSPPCTPSPLAKACDMMQMLGMFVFSYFTCYVSF